MIENSGMEAPKRPAEPGPASGPTIAATGRARGIEGGFTLVELMVVLLIMAILLAIAIPVFLGVKSGAYDRSTQSNLTDAIISGKTSYVATSAYSTGSKLGGDRLGLAGAEPHLHGRPPNRIRAPRRLRKRLDGRTTTAPRGLVGQWNMLGRRGQRG